MTGADVVTGGDIVGALLLADAAVLELVQAANIKAGRLPPNLTLPALLIKVVSVTERATLTREAKTFTTDRVTVAVRAANHRERKLAMRLVTDCCAGRTGTIAGISNVSILTAGRGPEIDGPGDTYEQSQDFRVSYDA